MYALQFYAFGLVGYSTLEVVARAMFAQQDTRTPLYVAIGALILNAVLGYLLLGLLRHGGLALASSLAVTGEVLVLLFILRRRLAGIEGPAVAATLLRSLCAAAAMALTMNGLLDTLGRLTASLNSRVALLLQMGLAGLIGLVIYILVAFALGAPEIRALPGLLRRRVAAG
jgi:putative peptidoglycan lipid II flippase